MEYPDQLKKPAPTRRPGFDALDDFLWEAASWDPDVEDLVLEICRDGTDTELAEATQRLLDQRLLTEPAMVYRAIRLMAEVGALNTGNLGTRTGRPDRVAGPLGGGGRVTGRDADRSRGLLSATRRRSGVNVLCITGPPGVGKTRLGSDIVTACVDQGATVRLEICLSSAGSGLGNRLLAKTPYDALLELLLGLGFPEADIPATAAERRACYTTALANRRPVILVDDAADASQVLPLLPPEEGTVVVTSRHQLTDLFGYGAEYLALQPLDAVGSRLLVRHCFRARGIEPDDAVTRAIHGWCAGLPLPTIIVSRWMTAAAAEGLPLTVLTARLGAAGRQAAAARGDFSQLSEVPAVDAVAAVVALLSEDQRAVARVFGVMRIPEADLRVVCLGADLRQERARLALEQLADLGLITQGESGRTWLMAPLVADYARAQLLAPGQLSEADFKQLLGRLTGLYRLRMQSLRDLMFAPQLAAGSSLQAWAQAQWEAERDSAAVVLDAAAAAPHPAMAGGLAAAFIDAAAHADQRAGGWRETERYIGPIVLIARSANDHRLEAAALWRFGYDAFRQGENVSASALLSAARESARLADDFQLSLKIEQALADLAARPGIRGLEPSSATAAPADAAAVAGPAQGDALGELEQIVAPADIGAAPPALLFGAKARAR